MTTYPSDPDISIVREKEIHSDRTLLHRFTMGTHTGTHLDAPAHIILGGKTLENIPLTSFSGLTVKVNKKTISALDDIDEKINGIIFDSDWYKNFNDSSKYYGSDRPDIPENLVNISIRRRIKFFGCDLPSVDKSGSKEKPIHKILLKSGIIIYESLTNLDQLPMLSPFNFYGFPLSFIGLDGSPVRAVAVTQ